MSQTNSITNNKTLTWTVIGTFLTIFVVLFFSMLAVAADIKKDTNAQIDKAIEMRAYAATSGIKLETELANMKTLLNKVDNKTDKILERLNAK